MNTLQLVEPSSSYRLIQNIRIKFITMTVFNRCDFAVKLVLIIAVCGVARAVSLTEKHGAICKTSQIEAKEGDNIALQCQVYSTVNLTASVMDCSRDDLNGVVASRRHGMANHDEQIEGYRNRVTISLEDLPGGKMTLWISSVQLSDSGTYTCFIKDVARCCSFHLNAVTKEKQKRTESHDGLGTTEAPLKTTKHPDTPDGNNMALILTIVLLAVFLLIGLALWKTGMIYQCVKKCGGHNQQAGDNPSPTELRPLENPSVKDDTTLNGSSAVIDLV